ncbi:MAG: AMP-binding protein [Candidatus Nanopelagicales bacterium]|nr:AMP-binding protein [Candidatus Nanopelagicales bacterium]
MSRRALSRILVPPGPPGVGLVAGALSRALSGGQPFAPIPLASQTTPAAHAAAMSAAVEASAPLKRDDIAIVLATSGSTGEPRGVVLTSSALTASAQLGSAAMGPPGVWLTAMPVTGIGGLLTVARALLAGGEPMAWPGVGGAEPFTAKSFTSTARSVLDRARADGLPAYVSLVPTQVTRLLGDPAALDALAGFGRVIVGGARLARHSRAAATAAGVRIVETYGMTETCGGVVYDGKPLPGVLVDVCADTGVVRLGGPTIAVGYRLRPDLDRRRFANGWFITSDLGRWDGETLTVLGRCDDVIKVGGVKVSLPAVTEAVRSDSRVIDALTVAAQDPEWGAVPTTYVVPDDASATRPGVLADALTVELIGIVTSRLGRASAPRRIEFVAELPHLPSGKAGILPHPAGGTLPHFVGGPPTKWGRGHPGPPADSQT